MAHGSHGTETAGAESEHPSAQILVHLAGLWKSLRRWVFLWTLIVFAAVFCLAIVIRYQAEKNLLSVFLAYMPAWVVSLPLLLTLGAGMVFACWRSLALSACGATLLVLWLGGYSFGWNTLQGGREDTSLRLSVMTYNRGQGSEKMLIDCAEASQPDIAVFQDSGHRLSRFAALPVFSKHRYTAQDGEYAILSRWPLLETQPLQLSWPSAKSKIWRAGTRSVIDWNGRRIIVYNIHFPTPRDLLFWYAKRGTFLYGVLGLFPYTSWNLRHQQYLSYWESRVSLAAQIADRLRVETEPVIMMGDFNFPPLGRSYDAISGILRDSHVESGGGFNYTFPGNFKSIGRLIAPWLRIDHVFVSSSWKILSCKAYKTGESQHLPVVAVFAQNLSARN